MSLFHYKETSLILQVKHAYAESHDLKCEANNFTVKRTDLKMRSELQLSPFRTMIIVVTNMR